MTGRAATPLLAQPNRAKQQHGGYKFVDAATAEWLAAVQTVGRCCFCPGFVVAGDAAKVVAAQKRHREETHPGLRSVTVAERKAAAKAAT